MDRYTGKLTKLVNPKWKCPFCGAKYSLVSGARALIIDDRESPEDAGEVLIFPLTYLKHQWEKDHPDYEMDKQVEALLDWLRMVSLMDQLTVIDADSISEASERTNYMVENRLKASSSVVYKRTRNICTEDIPYPTSNAKIVSLPPELSLATIGSTIPVIEVPDGLPYPSLHDMAYALTQIGHMIMECTMPKHTIEGLGDVTKSIPNTYTRGRLALAYCSEKVHP